jgi:hypothetical protein
MHVALGNHLGQLADVLLIVVEHFFLGQFAITILAQLSFDAMKAIPNIFCNIFCD